MVTLTPSVERRYTQSIQVMREPPVPFLSCIMDWPETIIIVFVELATIEQHGQTISMTIQHCTMHRRISIIICIVWFCTSINKHL